MNTSKKLSIVLAVAAAQVAQAGLITSYRYDRKVISVFTLSNWSGAPVGTSLIQNNEAFGGTWTVPGGVNSVDVLVVGGGGGGGFVGGGGGAGGLIYNTGFSVTPGGTITVSIGAGGAGDSNYGGTGANGGNSVFGSLTAIGGGGGGSITLNGNNWGTGGSGAAGGSGGGGSAADYIPQGLGGAGTSLQGNAGGKGPYSPSYPGYGWGAAGGGGAGGVGGDTSGTIQNSSISGNGGIGLQNSISGQLTYYAGGGGGGGYSENGTPGGTGGLGGGGNGNRNGSTSFAGTANTGGGGGGGHLQGGAGGSGIVIVSYYVPPLTWGTSGSGGSGTWGAGSAWNGSTWSNSFPDSAVFTGTGGTVSLTQSQTAQSMTFNSFAGAFVIGDLGGQTLQVNGDGMTMNSGAGAVTINSPVTLGAGQTWTNNSSSPLAVAGNVANGGNTLAVTGSGNTTISGTIAGAGGLSAVGTGKLVLAAANSYTGTTSVNAGTLQIGNGGTAGSISSSSVITGSAGGTLAFARTDDYGGAFTNTIGGAVGVALNSGTLVFTANNTYAGTTTINAGTLQVGNGGSIGKPGTGNITGSVGGAVVFNRTDTLSQSLSGTLNFGWLTGDIGVTQLGSGTLVLAGGNTNNQKNTYTGGTWIANGTLQLAGDGLKALPSQSAVTLGTGSTSGILDLNTLQTTLGSVTFNGTGSQMVPGGKLNLQAASGNATITVNSGSHAIHPDTSLLSNTVITMAANSFLSLHGTIDGSGSLTQLGSGTVEVSGVNSYSGGTYLSSGYMSVRNSGALGGGTVTIDGNSILNLNNTILTNQG